MESRHAADQPASVEVGPSLTVSGAQCGIAAGTRVLAAKSDSAVLPVACADLQTAAGVAPGRSQPLDRRCRCSQRKRRSKHRPGQREQEPVQPTHTGSMGMSQKSSGAGSVAAGRNPAASACFLTVRRSATS